MAHHSKPNSEVQHLTVEQLVDRLREGSLSDTSIYCEELIRRFEPLLRQAWRRGSAGQEYRDFLQDVFLRLFGGLPHLRDTKAFPGYFLKVALSVASDYLRRQRHRWANEAPDKKDLVFSFDERIITGIYVRSYLEHLSDKEKTILNLEFLEGYSARETALSLGITPGAVRVLKSRALKKLRDMIEVDAKAMERS